MATRFTRKERLAVVTEAIRLLKKPETWVKGKWECKLYRDPEGFLTPKHVSNRGKNAEAKDSRGRPLYAYCVNGALNKAAITVLGAKKAAKLMGGSLREVKEGDLGYTGISEIISTDADARQLGEEKYHREVGDALGLNDDPSTTHEDIMLLLKGKQKELKKQLKLA